MINMLENKVKKREKHLFRKCLIGAIVALSIGMIAFPLYWMLISSLKPSTELFASPPTIFPKSISLEWYKKAFQNSMVLTYFGNSFIVSSITTVVVTIVATFGAYGLTRFRFIGRKIITVSSLAAYCIPPIMLMVPLYRVVSKLRLISSLLGVIIGHLALTLPFAIWLLISFFKSIPREIEESALVNGASEFTVFRKIAIPLCAPGILSTAILVFILSWNEYLLASVMVSQDSMKTLTVGLANYISNVQIDWGIVMALGTATTIPIVLMFSLIQKYFVEGLTAGAIKG